jgi:acetolactate synthase I/II/III large subunit
MKQKTVCNLEELIGKKVDGADAYRYTLEMLGINKVFQFTGGKVLTLLDRIASSDKIEILLGPEMQVGSREADLGHAAQACYDITRVPANLIVTSGPGGTNPATAVANAMMDSSALILTVGQMSVSSLNDGEEAFQGVPISEPYKFWAKFTYTIRNVDELQDAIYAAFEAATTGRPGPSVLEIPSELFEKQTMLKSREELENKGKNNQNNLGLKASKIRMLPPVYELNEMAFAEMDEVARAYKTAKRAVIYAGGGVHLDGAVNKLLKLSENYRIPIVSSLKLVGAIPSEHSMNIGMAGMHGKPCANLALHNADFILAIGTRLDDRIIGDPKKFAPYCNGNIFWINPHTPGISRGIAKRVKKINMNASTAIDYLIQKKGCVLQPVVPEKENNAEKWIQEIKRWDLKYPLDFNLHCRIIRKISEIHRQYYEKEAYVATGVGGHQMFTANSWVFRPKPNKRMLLTSGGLGTMGVGLPFGVGAMIADPESPVYVFNGDGSFMMDESALMIAYHLKRDETRNKYGIKVIIFRNSSLGMVEYWQDVFYGQRKAASILNPPENYYKNIAAAYEAEHFMIDITENKTDMDGIDQKINFGAIRVINSFVRSNNNAVFEVRLPFEGIYPFIPPGRSVADMMINEKKRVNKEDI